MTSFNEYVPVFSVLIALASILLTLVSLLLNQFYQNQTLRNLAEQLKVSKSTFSLDILKWQVFIDERSKVDRSWVYDHCKELNNLNTMERWAKKADRKEIIKNVCNTMDLLAILVDSQNINEDEAVKYFGDSLIRTWTVLQNWIRLERTKSPAIYENFEQLKNKAANHGRWKSMTKDGVEISTPKQLLVFDFHSSVVIREETT